MVRSDYSSESVREFADDLIARHIEARGGLDRIMTVTTLRQRGTVQMPGALVHIYGERKRPDLLRIEFTVDGMTGIEGWDGTRAWEQNPWKGTAHGVYLEGAPSIALQRGAEFDGPLVGYLDKGHSAEYVGKATVEGSDTYHVKVTLRDGNVVDHYFDSETMLVTKTAAIRPIHGRDEAETQTFLDDYREVAGVLYPFMFREYAKGGEHSEVFQWEWMEANAPLEDERFGLSAGS